jgi:hypothetical protein
MRAEIRRFLELLKRAPADSVLCLEALAHSLDELVAAMRALPEGEVVDGWEKHPKPTADYYRQFSGEVAKSFPELGLYPWVDPVGSIDQSVMMADAIDDLADIAKDLSEALWAYENVGEATAQWDLHFGYRSHWGAHLHNLRAYLHAVITQL